MREYPLAPETITEADLVHLHTLVEWADLPPPAARETTVARAVLDLRQRAARLRQAGLRPTDEPPVLYHNPRL
jgi:hypothetical protein